MSNFVSDLTGMTVIDDGNWGTFAKPVDPSTGASESGYKAREWDRQPLCGVVGTVEFPQSLVYSRKELAEIVEEQERTGTRLIDVLRRGPKIWKNQSPSNYCWMYATVHAMQANRVFQNMPVADLSPLSSGCPCDGFANRGGYGQDALDWLIKYGACEERLWPSKNVNAGINRKYYTEEAKENALLYRVGEWYDFRSRDFMAKASAIVRYIPVSSGYNFMGHQMCTVAITLNGNGSFGCIDLDSYGSGGDFSTQALSESRGAADDMCAPRVAL